VFGVNDEKVNDKDVFKWVCEEAAKKKKTNTEKGLNIYNAGADLQNKSRPFRAA
jgi:hypothetical protein